MSRFIADNWLWITGLALGAFGIWIGVVTARSSGARGRILRYIIWGPFARPMTNYLVNHQHFSRREKYWAIALGLLMVAIILFALAGNWVTQDLSLLA